MKCIIGAEKKICDLLEEFISKSAFLNLAGTYYDSESVRSQLSHGQDIDLFFLDLEIPKLDLFNFIGSLNYQPKIIIISGSDQNAVKAFDFSAVDYLLKPITYARFFKAVDKAIRYHSPKESRNIAEDEIFIKKGPSLVKLRLKDLIYIEALENYIILHTKDEKYTIHFTMKAIENQLPAGDFIRVHRSFIANLSMIQSINEDSLDILVGKVLKNIPLGSSFRETLLNKLNMIVR
jgi:DNA-binding LytR/AlgR family response regulator